MTEASTTPTTAPPQPASSPATPAPSLPWTHPGHPELAAALGITDRTLRAWRARGCPGLAEPPHDELLIRLWHRLAIADQSLGANTKTLAPPGPALAPYLAIAEQLGQHAAPTADAAALLKRRQAERVALANSKARAEHRDQALAEFRRLLGRLEALLHTHLESAAALEALWHAAQHPRSAAEPALLTALRTRLRDALDASLAAPT